MKKITFVEAMVGRVSDFEMPNLAADTKVDSIDVSPTFRADVVHLLNRLVGVNAGVPLLQQDDVDKIATEIMSLIEESPDSFDVELEHPPLPDIEGVPLDSVGTGESVSRQVGNAFLPADIIAIVRLDDLQALIAKAHEAERREVAAA